MNLAQAFTWIWTATLSVLVVVGLVSELSFFLILAVSGGNPQQISGFIFGFPAAAVLVACIIYTFHPEASAAHFRPYLLSAFKAQATVFSAALASLIVTGIAVFLLLRQLRPDHVEEFWGVILS